MVSEVSLQNIIYTRNGINFKVCSTGNRTKFTPINISLQIFSFSETIIEKFILLHTG